MRSLSRSKIVLIAIISGAIFLLWAISDDLPENKAEILDKKALISLNGFEIRADFASSTAELAKGLSGREKLEMDEGMWFDFHSSNRWGIWMKDMKISIDIIWVDENLKIVHVEERVTPETFDKTFFPESDARYVLETASGFVEKSRLKVGDTVFVR